MLALTCDQINIILDEIKLEIDDNCETSDLQEDNDNTYDSVPLTRNDKSAEQILQILQYGLSLFKVMLILQKSQEMKSFNFSKLPFMSRVLVNSTSLFTALQEYNNLCFHSFRSVHVLQLGINTANRMRASRDATGYPRGTITDQESLVSYKVYRCGCSGL